MSNKDWAAGATHAMFESVALMTALSDVINALEKALLIALPYVEDADATLMAQGVHAQHLKMIREALAEADAVRK